MTKGPIAYVAPEAYAFVRKDIEGLRAIGVVVHDHYFNAQRALELPLAFVSQLLFLLKAKRHGVRHVVSHFAGYHSMLPALLGFRTHIIIAGADACSFPGIRYGSFRKPLMSAAMAYSMRNAETLLPVHESLRGFMNKFSEFGPVEQGYAYFVKGLKTHEHPLPYGFDATQWISTNNNASRAGAMCVAMGASAGNAIHFRKGIDLIIEAARSLPNVPFTVIGAAHTESYKGLPTNISIRGRVSHVEMRDLYHAHSLYLQPSVMEGFPNALCEAMLCGCIPVVSGITSMPSINGDAGVIITERKREALIIAINALLAADLETTETRRKLARERILPYSMQRRLDGLLGAIDREEP
ncbi:MAG: glycosyltransferase family 4 protein [Flavobacteriales bacterium]